MTEIAQEEDHSDSEDFDYEPTIYEWGGMGHYWGRKL